MKHPLNNFHFILRELRCFFLGHRWKSSWAARPDYNRLVELDYNSDEIRKLRKEHGNPYFHYRANWKHKCICCRLQVHNTDFFNKDALIPTLIDFVRRIPRTIVFEWGSTKEAKTLFHRIPAFSISVITQLVYEILDILLNPYSLNTLKSNVLDLQMWAMHHLIYKHLDDDENKATD